MSKTKICTKCETPKDIKEFFFRKDDNIYRRTCKKCFSKQTQEFKNDHPWRNHFYALRRRCSNPKASDYKWYGGRGIKCLITVEEVKELWFRDKAYLLEKPTIDREKHNNNYTYMNCKFIEHKYNAGKEQRKITLQYDLSGIFIKEWDSTQNAHRALNIASSSISCCCRNKKGYDTAGGFIWRYKQ